MPSLYRRVFGAVAVTLCFAAATSAQQPRQEATEEEDSAVVAEKKLRNRIFQVKNRNPESLASVLEPLGSRGYGTMIRPNRDLNTITVRDLPENIVIIEEALKRLDVPQTSSPDVELRLHLLIASSTEGAPDQFPAELNGVLKELRATLNFKNYALINSQVHRVKGNVGGQAIVGSGNSDIAQAPAGTFSYTYGIDSISIQPNSSGPSVVQLNNFYFNTGNDVPGRPGVKTSVNLRDGEKAIVGTASFKDKGLILILSAKMIN